jgi:LmeA-like phospholipid-binding
MTARRAARRPLAVVLALLVLLVAADRVAAWAAERPIAESVTATSSAAGATTAPPTVDLAGFPFLAQVLQGRYHEVRIRTAQVRTERRIPIYDVDVRALGVRLPLTELLNGARRLQAEQVEGTALVHYDAVAVALGLPNLQLSGENGAVRLRTTVTVAGALLPVTGLLSVVVQGASVQLEGHNFTAAGFPVPPDRVERQLQELNRRVRSLELPYRLRLTRVEALSTGLRLTGTGEDVVLGR